MLSRWVRLMEMLMGEASCSDKIKKLCVCQPPLGSRAIQNTDLLRMCFACGCSRLPSHYGSRTCLPRRSFPSTSQA